MKIRGEIKKIFYPKSGMDPDELFQFIGFSLKIKGQKGTVSCFGKLQYMELPAYVELEGYYDSDSRFYFTSGFRVGDDEIGAANMLKWLFGEKTSARVLEAYDGDSLMAYDHFKNHPDIFLERTKKVKRFSQKTYEKALKKADSQGVEALFERFFKYGFTQTHAIKVYKEFGEHAMKIIDKNPYKLIPLLSFNLVDKIAKQEYKLDDYDPRRVCAGCENALYKARSEGHCYLNLSEPSAYTQTPSLKQEVFKLLGCRDISLVNEQIIKLIEEGKLVKRRHRFKDIIMLPYIAKAEDGVAEEVTSRLRTDEVDEDLVDEMIADHEATAFKLDPLQIEAVKTSVANEFSIVSGPPGAGKTTIINLIVNILLAAHPGAHLKMCSPTGKAAQRITESTGRKATTIHRLLQYDPVTKGFVHDKNNPLDCDILVVDEFSMCGVNLFYSLIQALPKGCHIILVGDKDQLPSIEAGKVLEDLVSIDFIPKTILTKVFRQDDGSAILSDALAIGREDVEAIHNFKDASDVKFYGLSNIQESVVDNFMDSVEEYGVDQTCILIPQNIGDLGTEAFNALIQNRLNPFKYEEDQLKIGKSRVFRLNDRVIQTVNDPDRGVFNGDVGTIIDVSRREETGHKDELTVLYSDEREVTYYRDTFDQLKLAYALTIHKSQGSEYAHVILLLHPAHKFMLRKKLVYTGWTRARKQLDVYGDKNMIMYSIKNQDKDRNSLLRSQLYSLHNYEKEED